MPPSLSPAAVSSPPKRGSDFATRSTAAWESAFEAPPCRFWIKLRREAWPVNCKGVYRVQARRPVHEASKAVE